MSTCRRQQGAGLIEFMVASLIGIIALMTIGSLYINTMKVATERYKQLTLLQNTLSVTQMLGNDIQRAGFDGNNGYSTRISGAAETLYTCNSTDGSLVAYAYYIGVSGASPLYKNVVYEQRSGASSSLLICEKKQTTLMDINQVVNLTGSGLCYNLFDPKVIKVSDFDVSSEKIEGLKARSALVNIALGTYLTEQPSLNTQQVLTIKQRNWQ